MTTAQVLEQLKSRMRIRHEALDGVLTEDINAGALELTRAGVSVYKEDPGTELRDDALIATAICYHAMAAEDYGGKAQQYQQSFEKLRDALSQSGGYQCETS